MIDLSDGIKNCSGSLDKRVLMKMTSGSTFSKRVAKVLDANLVLRDIGRQFFTNLSSFPFFSIKVITAWFCESDYQTPTFKTRAKRLRKTRQLNHRSPAIYLEGLQYIVAFFIPEDTLANVPLPLR